MHKNTLHIAICPRKVCGYTWVQNKKTWDYLRLICPGCRKPFNVTAKKK